MSHPQRILRRRRLGASGGLTLVELVLGMVVLLVSVGSTMGALNSYVKLQDSNRETTVAHFALRQTLERIRNTPFNQVYASFNATDADDPAGLTDGGPSFAVEGLDLRDGDPDGMAGQILFPANLTETTADLDFGLPMDLNGDGTLDADDRSGDYEVLPIRIRLEWRGRSGNRVAELQTLLRRP